MALVDIPHSPNLVCPTGEEAIRAPAFPADTIQSVHIEQVSPLQWETIASGFLDVNQEQTHCFNAAKWGAERVELSVVRDGSTIIGGAAVVVFQIPGTRRAMSLIKWGPLWRRPDMPNDPERLLTVLKALKQDYAERRGHYLSVFPHADPEFGEQTCTLLQALDFNPYWSHNDPDRYLVNVAISPEEMRSSLSQKWRYNLKKSAKNDLEIVEVDSEDGFDQFMTLYRDMLTRKGFFDSSAIATLPALMQASVGALRPKIFLVSHKGLPTAGAVIDMSGDRAVYLYGATDERALGLKAGYAMHWWIAERLSRNPDIRWYDLGGKDGDGGLHQFKKGFVGKRGAIIPTPPSYEFAMDWKGRVLGRAIFALRDAKARVDHLLYKAKSALRS